MFWGEAIERVGVKKQASNRGFLPAKRAIENEPMPSPSENIANRVA